MKMKNGIKIFTALLIFSACIVSEGIAELKNKPVLNRFSMVVGELVKKYYPSAYFELKGNNIYFSHNTRSFFIHFGTKNGEWQDASKVIGPNKGGVFGEIEVEDGPPMPRAAVVFKEEEAVGSDWFYFTNYYFSPYSQKYDCHLSATLRCNKGSFKEFVKEFSELINRFEEYL
jgi:hypothetical protein